MNFKKDKPIVLKIGSAVLTNEKGDIDKAIIENICTNVSELKKKGYTFAIVSSGAIGAGRSVIQQDNKPLKLKKKQALAAIGQVLLMQIYQQFFEKHNIYIGQILLSHEDFRHRKSFLNTRSTLNQLIDLDVVPIINENDTVSTEEIQFGDNDRMSVLIANALESEEVIFLSTTEGLMDFNDKNQKIDVVEKIDEKVFSMAKGGNAMGTGGMGSKLISIDTLNKAGKTAWLAHGKNPDILLDLFKKKNTGTCFKGVIERKTSKEQWMLQHLHPHGEIVIDTGAFKALTQKKASLLLQGIVKFSGLWEVGQLISLYHNEVEVARGMARMDSKSLAGLLEDDHLDVENLKEQGLPKFLIHRDDIAILET